MFTLLPVLCTEYSVHYKPDFGGREEKKERDGIWGSVKDRRMPGMPTNPPLVALCTTSRARQGSVIKIDLENNQAYSVLLPGLVSDPWHVSLDRKVVLFLSRSPTGGTSEMYTALWTLYFLSVRSPLSLYDLCTGRRTEQSVSWLVVTSIQSPVSSLQ